MTRIGPVMLLAAGLWGCGGSSQQDAPAAAARDTVSQATRDSAVARSGLPGASAVGRAQDAAGAAQERAARLDSLQR